MLVSLFLKIFDMLIRIKSTHAQVEGDVPKLLYGFAFLNASLSIIFIVLSVFLRAFFFGSQKPCTFRTVSGAQEAGRQREKVRIKQWNLALLFWSCNYIK